MDKNGIVVTETFCSGTEEERKENVQQAVARYIRLVLKRGGLSTGEACSGEAGEQNP